MTEASNADKNCLSDRQLQQLLEPNSELGEQACVERHLESCADCRRRLDRLAGPAPPAAPTHDTEDVTSSALTRVMHDLCRLQPQRPPGHAAPSSRSSGIGSPFPYLAPSSRAGSLGRLEKYEILRVLGQGGMGIVFEAIDPSLHRHVAIKVPAASQVATTESHDRFVREARAMASVKHDHIVTIHAVDESQGVPFMVMEYVAGRSLQDLLTDGQPLDVEQVVKIAIETADALQAAHGRGLVHRDIKPANILLEEPGGRVKVADFGLAKSATDMSLTAAGLVAGTPEFMSPEQAADEPVTPRSDLFSLGIVLYTALAGQSPFRGQNPLSTLRRICGETPRPLNEINKDVPGWLAQLIQQLLSKDPADRPESAAALQRALRQRTPVARSPRVVDPSAATPGRRPAILSRHRLLWSLGGLLVAATVGLIWLARPGREATTSLATPAPINTRPASDAAPTPTVPGFYVGDARQHYPDLGAALAAASDGDTIRIAGNGPFAVAGFDLGARQLTIAALPGSQPVFLAESASVTSEQSFLRTRGRLSLQGLEIRWQIKAAPGLSSETRSQMCIVFADQADLQLTRCRLIGTRFTCCAGVSEGSIMLEGCQFGAQAAPCLMWQPMRGTELSMHDCVLQGRVAMVVDTPKTAAGSLSPRITLRQNTFTTERALQLIVGQPRQEFDVQASHNVFDVEDLVVLAPQNNLRQMRRPNSSAQVRMLARSLLDWTDAHNAYRRQMNYLSRGLIRMDEPARRDISTLDDWLAMWNGQTVTSFVSDFQYQDDSTPQRRMTPALLNPEPPERLGAEKIGADENRVGPE